MTFHSILGPYLYARFTLGLLVEYTPSYYQFPRLAREPITEAILFRVYSLLQLCLFMEWLGTVAGPWVLMKFGPAW